ncbi:MULTISPECIES: YchJ family protein [Psychrobacter]|uniref:YchJ family protein n=1 Tax=Psychrobacter TaxID=497 RepID=UPI00146AF64E|nr:MULTISPECIES: YchJ family protein [Psychrobacter]
MRCPCQITPDLLSSSDAENSSLENLTEYKSYLDCCKPFHEGKLPKTAEQLMRSRYSAFVMVNPDYIVKTTLPAQQSLLDKNAIAAWAKDTKWSGLEIINHKPIGKHHDQVEFKAYFKNNNGLQAHHELSSFVLVKSNLIENRNQRTQWYFLDPTVDFKISQKQPCSCGSGERFKRCCGRFLP